MHSRYGLALAVLLGVGAAGALWLKEAEERTGSDAAAADTNSSVRPSQAPQERAPSAPASGWRSTPAAAQDPVAPADRRARFDQALEALQAASARGAVGHELAQALEATWRAALDDGVAGEAANIIANWHDHPEPQVQELVTEALAALSANQQATDRAATDPTLGHELLRDQALYGATPELRHDAISELGTLDNPLREAWLALVLAQEPDPALRELAHSLLSSPRP